MIWGRDVASPRGLFFFFVNKLNQLIFQREFQLVHTVKVGRYAGSTRDGPDS